MKRIGHLMEKMLTEENFIKAERLVGKNKPKNRVAKHISRNAEKYGTLLLEEVKNGYQWHTPKRKTITDSYKGKTRDLKIPCLKDQAAQIAWLNIAAPIIEKRNYFYNCGSIPHAGQTRCVKALKRWLKDPKMKYGATTDIRKFYDTCPHNAVRRGFERIFKDKAFVDYAMGFVASMSDNDIGLAIGYPVSHWLANVVLMELDHELKRNYPTVKFTRYMDDVGLVARNKRMLRRAVLFLKDGIEKIGMRLKKWAVFRIKGRGMAYLSYRFFNGYTVLSKRLMVRISRRMKRAGENMSVHAALSIISYFGILKWCDSYNFRKAYVYPYATKRMCVRIISNNAKKRAA